MVEKVAVLGTGPGGLAIAADLASHGRAVVLADLPEFQVNLAAVAERGGVVVASGWDGEKLIPVGVTESVADAVGDAALVVLSVPAIGHERFVNELVHVLPQHAVILFVGEGGGALVAWRALRAAARDDVTVGETNCLPYLARLTGDATVVADRKSGGVLLAAIPAHNARALIELVGDVWPFLEPADSVWDTVLVNYDAIDIVPVALTNAATLESRPGGMLLWGEGATPSVVRLIEAVDGELLALRETLGTSDHRRYRDFLIAQGLAPDVGDLYAVMRAGGITRSVRPSGSREALVARLALEVPYSLVFASSLGDAMGVKTPVIDGLIALSAVILGQDVWAEGRTIQRLGLSGMDAAEMRAYALTGSYPDRLTSRQ